MTVQEVLEALSSTESFIYVDDNYISDRFIRDCIYNGVAVKALRVERIERLNEPDLVVIKEVKLSL